MRLEDCKTIKDKFMILNKKNGIGRERASTK